MIRTRCAMCRCAAGHSREKGAPYSISPLSDREGHLETLSRWPGNGTLQPKNYVMTMVRGPGCQVDKHTQHCMHCTKLLSHALHILGHTLPLAQFSSSLLAPCQHTMTISCSRLTCPGGHAHWAVKTLEGEGPFTTLVQTIAPPNALHACNLTSGEGVTVLLSLAGVCAPYT